MVLIIPIVIETQSHRSQIFTLVSEIHENVYLILVMKNIFELDGIINSSELCFSFLNRSIPIFPKEQLILKPKEQRFIKIETSFIDEISGLAIVKMFNKKVQHTRMFKCKFVQNLSNLNVTNSSLETIIFDPREMLGI